MTGLQSTPHLTARVVTTCASALILLALGCREPLPVSIDPPGQASAMGTVSASGLWASVVDGETGPGSSYRLYRPTAWNGELVVYAHGYVEPYFPLALPGEGDYMAEIFGEQGFAVALSSYSDNGLIVKDGAQRTHQLRGLFTSRFGRPSRTYLAGLSMGGFIVSSLAERYPKQYDGVLALCGVMGGFPQIMQYWLDARALFDYYYPGVLPGALRSVPPTEDWVTDYLLPAYLAISGDPAGATAMARVDQTPLQLPPAVSDDEFAWIAALASAAHALVVNDVVARAHGLPMGNTGVTYTSAFLSPAQLAQLNAGVARTAADRQAVNWLALNGENSGQLTIPMLTLHTTHDDLIPIFTEAAYHAKVVAAGRGSLLVQRGIDRYGHCTFTSAEIAQGLADLTTWVRGGPKPTP